MFLEGILAISGESGLFKLISKGKNSVIVESLNNGKRMPVFSTSNISTLEDVAIYTNSEDVPLRKVFLSIFEKYNGENILQGKVTNKELMDLLESVLPEYDKDRVYVSDAKKLVNWYNILITKKILTSDSIKEEVKEDSADIKEKE